MVAFAFLLLLLHSVHIILTVPVVVSWIWNEFRSGSDVMSEESEREKTEHETQ